VKDTTDESSSAVKPVLDYGRPGPNPQDLPRISRLAIASLWISIFGTPPLLNKLIASSLLRWLLRVGVQVDTAEYIIFGCVMTPALLAFILATCAAWRIGHDRDHLRGEALAMIVMSICVFWFLGGACVLMFWPYKG
jgi:hypothetical protein